jgi:sugar-specific transcriptional regulator TrmB
MAKDQHKNVTVELQELGLSPHEALIYLTVLKLGESSAGNILDDVKLHREQVYRALKRLVDMGLLTQFIKRKRGYYSAIDPNVLVRRMQAKVEIAQSLQPILRKFREEQKQIIQVREGADALRWLLEDIVITLKKDAEYQVLGGAGHRFLQLVKDYWPIHQRALEKKKISYRTLTYEGQDYSHAIRAKAETREIRYLPQNFISPAATIIYANKVGLEIFDTENPDNTAVILIENQKVADAYRQTFESLWQMGLPYTTT